METTWVEADPRFVVGGVMVHADDTATLPVNIELDIETVDGRPFRQTIELTEDKQSDARFYASPLVRKIKAVSDLPDGIAGEVYEALKMKPRIWDAYAVLRVRNNVPDIGNNNDKIYSDEYFEDGTLYGGAFEDANPDDPLDMFPPYRIIKSFINDLFRIFNYDRLRGYEVETDEDGDEHSVLYFDTDSLAGGSQLNMFEGMIHERLSVAPIRGLTEEWAFQIGGRCPANDSNPLGQNIFKETAYPQIRGALSASERDRGGFLSGIWNPSPLSSRTSSISNSS